MDEVFRALADPTRRSLLDALYRVDGQTLSSLEARLPISRFGVMKHLKLLEEANLVTTRRQGREKLHFLNPVPIRLVHDRWVSKFAEPWVATLSDLKSSLEATMEKVYEIYIRTTPERLWEAITDGEIRAKYNFGVQVLSDWTPGSTFEMRHAGDNTLVGTGENLEISPPHKLVQSVTMLFAPETEAEGRTRLTWQIEPVGDSCKLVLTHDELSENANEMIYGGWPMILSGLKTWLETGESLTTPGSLLYNN